MSSTSTSPRQVTLLQATTRATKHLVPFMMLLYVLAFLDRSNIGYAQQSYMVDTGVSEGTYAMGAGIFFVMYSFLGAPANLMMRKIGARRWIGSTTVAWGIVSACMALADTGWKFLLIRFILGIVEAGFFPGMIYLTSIFFPEKKRATVTGLFYMGAPLALALGSPLSGALLQMHGVASKPGWWWMFLIEGSIAALVGVACFLFFDDSPRSARFLTPEERDVLAGEIESEDKSKTASSIRDALKSGRVWALGMCYFAIQVAVYGVTFYLPTQVAGIMGQQVGLKVSLVVAIPWVCALVGTYLIPRAAEKANHQRIVSAAVLLVAGLALAVSAVAPPVAAVIALCFVATGIIACQPLFWTMPTSLLSGAALAAGIGFVNTLGGIGSFLAPNLRVWVNELFGADTRSIPGLVAIALVAVLGAIGIYTLKENTTHEHTELLQDPSPEPAAPSARPAVGDAGGPVAERRIADDR